MINLINHFVGVGRFKSIPLKTVGVIFLFLIFITGISGCTTLKCIFGQVKSSIFKCQQPDFDGDHIIDVCDPDDDNDSIPDDKDPCPRDEDNDKDGDQFCGDIDNCPDVFQKDQNDLDKDGIGDACDDTDWDLIVDSKDRCPFDPNNDADSDGVCANLPEICGQVGDICLPKDLCPSTPLGVSVDKNGCSTTQIPPSGAYGDKPPCTGKNCPPEEQITDSDKDGKADAEEPESCVGPVDCDADGVNDGSDNCITVDNGPISGTCVEGNVGVSCTNDSGCGTGGMCSMDQENSDNDLMGDACDDDDDNDVYPDLQDNCRIIFNDQADFDCDGRGDICDDDLDGDGLTLVQETELGTDPSNPDSDFDAYPDGPPPYNYACIPDTSGVNWSLGKDPYPTGDPQWTIVFEVYDGNTNITGKWLPKPNQPAYASVVSLPTPDYLAPPRDNPALPAVPWIEKSHVTIVATLKDPKDNSQPFVKDVTFTINPNGSSRKPGVAINDDTEACSPDCSNDFSFDPMDTTTLSKTVSPGSSVTADLYAFDYGGWVLISANTKLVDGTAVTGEIKLPLDTDRDDLPDIWEVYHSTAGFNKLNKNSFGQNLSDGNEDIDQSLNNTHNGDGIINYSEYRGIILDNTDGKAVSYIRLNPMMKDLFVRGDNFKNAIPPSNVTNVLNFSVDVPAGSAFEEARIAVHDVTGMLSFSGAVEPPNIDVLVVQNVTDTTKNELRDDDGFINHYASRSWSWDYKGVSYSGQTDAYSYDPVLNKKGTFLYHLNLMHYVYNRPYWDEIIDPNYPGWTTYQTPLNSPLYVGLLDPLDKVEDYFLENGIGPESRRGNKENRFRKDQDTVLDGDHMMTDWTDASEYYGTLTVTDEPYKVGYQFSVFDSDGDGLVEWPVVEDPQGVLTYNPNNPDVDGTGKPLEYTPDWLQLHTTIHEMGHGAGINRHTNDHTCVMDDANLTWDRAGHFSDLARSLILIHNKN